MREPSLGYSPECGYLRATGSEPGSVGSARPGRTTNTNRLFAVAFVYPPSGGSVYAAAGPASTTAARSANAGRRIGSLRGSPVRRPAGRIVPGQGSRSTTLILACG